MKDFATNDKAHFDYEILETIEAGIVLKGYEVKSIKTGHITIKGSYVKIINSEPVLVGANIPPYQPTNMPGDYDPQASRKLLLSKKQIGVLADLAQSQGITLIPLKIYEKNKKLKLLIGIAKGKKKYDKRESIKKKDLQRSKERGTFEE
jgi:SsrA-binding protein